MSHPNPDRDERVQQCPERVFIERDNNGDYHTCPRGFHDAEYIRADIAATRMRDRCVVHLRATADALDVRQETECPSGTAFNSEAALRRQIATEIKFLTLEGEQEK